MGKITLLLRKGDDGKRVIRRAVRISPRLEDWLYEIAKRNRVLTQNFGLPDDPEELHKRSLEGDKDFRRFLIELIKKGDGEISMLKKWIADAI